MKVKYLRDSKKRRIDIRKLAGDKLKYFTVTQGACSDGCYIFMAFEQKVKDDRPHRIKIVKFDPATKKVLAVSPAMDLGHANDMCYKDGILYITHSKGDKDIHRVSAKTLRKLADAKVRDVKSSVVGFNGIAVTDDGFILRCMGGNHICYTDFNFNVKKNVKCTDPFKALKVDSQGMTYDSEKRIIYRSYSRLQSKSKNFLCKFDRKGKLKSKSKVNLTGELESVFLRGGELYGTSYRKKGDGKGGKNYMAYVFKIVK